MNKAESQYGLYTEVRQRIGTLIAFVPGMSFDPAPLYAMPCLCRIQGLPQIDIFYRFACGGFPAARFPAVYPFADAFLYVLAVRVDCHFARAFQRRQRFDYSL